MGISHSLEDPSEQDRNLRFYRNEIKSSPWPGSKIQDMLLWAGKYSKLENNHNYIQWLFPTPEGSGMNPYAQPLREHEAQAIREDELASARVLMSYRMMLDFYGMRLVNEIEGKVIRSENWQDRYKHLNRSTHNYRRITRILKSLGELGFERFQWQWIMFLMEESVINRVLPNLNGPCMKHFIGAIKDERERGHMYENYLELMKKPQPGLCPSPRQSTGHNNNETLVKREAEAEDKQQNRDETFPNGGMDGLQQNIDSDKDSETLKSTNIPMADTNDTVDFGPAAERKEENESIPCIDHDTCTCDETAQQTECGNFDKNDNVSDVAETSIDVGSVMSNVKL